MIRVLRYLALPCALFLFACASPPPAPSAAFQAASADIDWGAAPAVTVKLSDFDFVPSHPTFLTGRPVRLILVNDSDGRHDFSAPGFFAAAAYRPGGAMPQGGKVVVEQDKTAEIDLVPGVPGQYPLECTEFLHSLFGMTGAITVTGAPG